MNYLAGIDTSVHVRMMARWGHLFGLDNTAAGLRVSKTTKKSRIFALKV